MTTNQLAIRDGVMTGMQVAELYAECAQLMDEIGVWSGGWKLVLDRVPDVDGDGATLVYRSPSKIDYVTIEIVSVDDEGICAEEGCER